MDQVCESVIQKRNAVPQHIPLDSAYQQRALSNTNLRVYADANHPRSLSVNRIAMSPLQL
jgi:hypothetical protein